MQYVVCYAQYYLRCDAYKQPVQHVSYAASVTKALLRQGSLLWKQLLLLVVVVLEHQQVLLCYCQEAAASACRSTKQD